MARRNDHSRDELREMALSAAETLLDQQGSEALSTRKIASAIGYSVGSLYQIFKNYDDLCWQLNLRTLQMLLQALDQQPAEGPQAALLQYADSYLTFANEWPQRWRLLFEYSTPHDLQAPEALNEAITQLFDRIETPLSEVMSQQSEVQISSAARTLWAGVHGIAVLGAHNKLFQADHICASTMAHELICRYLNGWQQEGSQ
ncbi:MAG: TetR/AcrR family transcriptional regulator [Marinobacterium sp.]|nr:TetR/AcrR family transcriptional regulator [Marinobacterium sp.]